MGMPMEHPEVTGLRSLLNVSRILILIIGVLTLLAAVAEFALFFGFGVFSGGFALVAFIVQVLIYLRLKETISLVNAGQFAKAKEGLLLWMILGFIFGWLIVGILLLLAYLKFDTLIAWQHQSQMVGQAPGWGQAAPPQSWPAQSAPVAAAPMAAPVASPASTPPTCPQCRQPGTWIAQYNRWYCYTDRQYL